MDEDARQLGSLKEIIREVIILDAGGMKLYFLLI